MKLRDSSKTRVAPILSMMAEKEGWVRQLVRSADFGAERFAYREEILRDPPPEKCWWGQSERGLAPPLSRLEWLVQHLEEPVGGNWGSPAVEGKRRLLVDKNAAVIEEALQLLRAGARGKEWQVLEGPSYPDALIESDDYLLVIEGKRTERGPTTKTTWSAQRHQMWRHMDAAWEIRADRPVIGLMVVEGSPDGSVPEAWGNAALDLQKDEAVDASLPHRDKSTRAAIRCSFAGVTTWQRLMLLVGEDPTQLPDTVGDVGAWCAARGVDISTTETSSV